MVKNPQNGQARSTIVTHSRVATFAPVTTTFLPDDDEDATEAEAFEEEDLDDVPISLRCVTSRFKG